MTGKGQPRSDELDARLVGAYEDAKARDDGRRIRRTDLVAHEDWCCAKGSACPEGVCEGGEANCRCLASKINAEIPVLRARVAELEAKIRWVDDHCGHVMSPCGCPKSPDPEQAYLAVCKALEQSQAENAALRGVVSQVREAQTTNRLRFQLSGMSADAFALHHAIDAALAAAVPPVAPKETS